MTDFAMRQRLFMLAGEQTVDKLNLEQAERYLEHIVEEVSELHEAYSMGDFVKVLDGLADLKVVANGMTWSLGVNPSQIDSLVADANDRKLVGGKVYRRPDGQVGKPPNWTGPEAGIEEVWNRVQAD